MILSRATMLLIINLILSLLLACNSGTKSPNGKFESKPKRLFTLLAPSVDQVYSFSDSVFFDIKVEKKNILPDSTLIFIDGKRVSVEILSPLSFVRSSMFSKTGRQDLRIKICYNDSSAQTITSRVTILSDIEPASLNFRIVNRIQHDPDAYIQGLFYYKGKLYESTGLKRKSRLMKVEPATGKIIMDRHLGDEYFGEGITRWKDQIYQLTYQQKVGFVFDLESFEQIREFDLQTMEGWGLTNDDKSLIVSDGSSVLYFYDPEYFSLVDQLDVCDNRGLLTRLNELEYLDGIIWANVYGEPYLVKIDAKSGKVIAKLDLETLYPKGITHDLDHTLNGIAYDPDRNTFFVSGKLWPVMYEIRVGE
jgi:glutaminyl-peptide cyclotransferase